MDWTQFFICITGLIGHLLIAKQDRRGYIFWIAGNFAIIKLSLADAHYGMAGLFVVYTIISIQALRSWSRKRNTPLKSIRERLKSAMNNFLQCLRGVNITSQVTIQPEGKV